VQLLFFLGVDPKILSKTRETIKCFREKTTHHQKRRSRKKHGKACKQNFGGNLHLFGH
jgi:hypothetical protein